MLLVKLVTELTDPLSAKASCDSALFSAASERNKDALCDAFSVSPMTVPADMLSPMS